MWIKRQLRRLYAPVEEPLKDLRAVATLQAISALHGTERYRDDRRLLRYGFKAHSQGDEDGIIAEALRRIGVEHRRFLEIGVGDGLENNTHYLLLQGFRGAWVEADAKNMRTLLRTFAGPLDLGHLQLIKAFVNAENIDELVGRTEAKADVDVLSIDIDNNDYHVLAAMKSLRARLIVVEYNAKLRPPVDWTISYDSGRTTAGTNAYGSSLQALTRLLQERGYALVGCSITGVNAFFVRQDLTGDHFAEPFTAENHFEPLRAYLVPGLAHGGLPGWADPAPSR